MTLRNFLKITALILIITGLVGLVFNGVAGEPSSTRTIIFAVVELVGMVSLGFGPFGLEG
jgi:hypothetical protein